ncbi:MAG: hypothetical protein EOO01_00285 [Chitinophagaceae bacterium]|nr:MAG: hypothetical protein EOO01_00285 [Chitinophagaceae bacterium]
MESDHLLTKLQELTADLLFISESESYLEVTRGSDPDLGKSVLADLSQRQVSPDSLVMTETEAFFEALFFYRTVRVSGADSNCC